MDRRDFLLTAAKAAVLTQMGNKAIASDTELSVSDPGAAAQRRRLSLDDGWRFHLGDVTDGQSSLMDDSDWQLLDVPHDWGIAGPFAEDNPSGPMGAYLPGGIGWYRKQLVLPPDSAGKMIRIEFDGVYMNSDVWINGHHLGLRPYGYSSFEYDMTPYLHNDGTANVIAVRVNNSLQPNSRWYSGSGIYRHVWLNVTSQVAVDHWGTSVTTPSITSESATVMIAVQVRNANAAAQKAQVATEILTTEGISVAQVKNDVHLSGPTATTGLELKVSFPKLWSPEEPHLYIARTTVYIDGKPIDTYDTVFGIRTFAFDAENGFSLNGKSMKFQGVCMHHDLGALGAAFSGEAAERRLRMLKQIGCNAIRMTHNPPAPQLLDLCDRMGFLVIDEAFDEWSVGKSRIAFGYHLYFQEWAERDLRDMILRDRNHPSIVLWSIGNEIPDKGKSSGVKTCKMLSKIVHQADPTRPVTAAVNQIENANKSGYAQVLDVVGYNGGGNSAFFYASDHAEYPRRKIYGSEVPHTAQTRGVYRSDPYYCSSYDETFIDLTCEDSWKLTHDKNYLAGEFRWIGFDYLGEPARHVAFHIPARVNDASWPSRSSESGIFDTCGFAKDASYFYQSQWTSEPMLHLFPHWSWKGDETKPVRVCCYTNCDFVELFLNDRSMGKKYVFPDGPLHVEWTVIYEPGQLKAVGWKGGKQVCDQEIRTAGAASRIVLQPEKTGLKSDGHDLVYLRAMIADDNGTMVPDAKHLVTFAVEGPARLIAVDNGDTNSHELFRGSAIAAFHGLCLAVVRSTADMGKVTISASSPGLRPGVTLLEAKRENGMAAQAHGLIAPDRAHLDPSATFLRGLFGDGKV